MTVSSENNKSGPYTGNGVTTVFDYEFKIEDAAHILVVVTDADGIASQLVLNDDYSVSGVGDDEGSVTLVDPLAVGSTILLTYNVPFTQETDLENQGAYYAETVERALDLSAMRDKQLSERIDRLALGNPAGIANSDGMVEGVAHLFQTVAERGLLAALNIVTRSSIATLTPDAGVTRLWISGYAAIGDAPPIVYIRGTSGGGAAIQDALGAWWEIAPHQTVSPPHFGALRGRANAAVTAAAIQAMIDFCEASGSSFDLLGGNWFISSGLTISAPITGYGQGRGYWHPKGPASGDGVPSIAATQIILTGTGPKIHQVHGISSMRASGGVITNSSATAGNDAEYSLSSFMNEVSDGGEPRSPVLFSVGLWIGAGADGAVLSDFRVLPDGGGDDGLDVYVTAGIASDPWAADWDYGILREMSQETVLRNVESVGHFRRAGYEILAIPADPDDDAVAALWGGSHYNCQFAGFKALDIRGPDMCRVTAVGADYIEVPWWDDHPFDPAVFDWLGIGSGGFTLTKSINFSSMSKVSSSLRLGGISGGDISGISIGDYVTSRRFGAGSSHIFFDDDCKFNGMHHQSGEVCHSSALGGNAMPNPGTIISASGWRATELIIHGSVQTIEEVGLHVHALAGSRIIPNWEGVGPKPLRLLTSPHEAVSTRVSEPAGKTQFCIIDSARGLRNETGVDARPRLASATADSAYASDAGFFQGFDIQTPSLLIDAKGDNGTGSGANPRSAGLRAQPGLQTGILDGDGAGLMYYEGNGDDVLRHARSLEPATNNARDLGSAALRYRAVYALQYRFAGGTQMLTAGVGTPEGTLAAPVGSLYLNLSGGASTTLYVKTSGTGNTGWTAK